MSNEPRRYICERCGGHGQQVAGLWNAATSKYDAPAGVCDGCNGTGYLGVIEQPLDLDALAAIVGKRTPGELTPFNNMVLIESNGFALCMNANDAAAIVAAVNAIGPLIERCKRAEAANEARLAEVEQIADLTRQRDELLRRLEIIDDDPPIGLSWDWHREMAKDAIRSVKGGADGT